jgi:hypothetical protein
MGVVHPRYSIHQQTILSKYYVNLTIVLTVDSRCYYIYIVHVLAYNCTMAMARQRCAIIIDQYCVAAIGN